MAYLLNKRRGVHFFPRDIHARCTGSLRSFAQQEYGEGRSGIGCRRSESPDVECGEIQMEGEVGGPNALRVPTVREGMVAEKRRQVIATRSSYPKKSTPDRTGELQGRRERWL
jgi:hypothetical protein